MHQDLTNKVCLITGCDEGLGLGLAVGFARRGAKVAAGLLRPMSPPSSLKPESDVLPLAMDVTNPGQVTAAVHTCLAKFGRIDVLINNAGIYPRCPATELNEARWRETMGINLDGVWRCIEAVIPTMISQGTGSIINIGSIGFIAGTANLAHYHSSKAAIVGLTRGLARDLGPHGVRVNAVHLGAVLTDGELRMFPDQAKVARETTAGQCLPGRITPETVEPVFAFLASEASGDITGQGIVADRGWVHQ